MLKLSYCKKALNILWIITSLYDNTAATTNHVSDWTQQMLLCLGLYCYTALTQSYFIYVGRVKHNICYCYIISTST